MAAGQKQTFALLGTSYDFSVLKRFAQLGQFKNTGYTGASQIDADLYQLGASVPITSAGNVLVSWGQSQESATEGGSTSGGEHAIFTLA